MPCSNTVVLAGVVLDPDLAAGQQRLGPSRSLLAKALHRLARVLRFRVSIPISRRVTDRPLMLTLAVSPSTTRVTAYGPFASAGRVRPELPAAGWAVEVVAAVGVPEPKDLAAVPVEQPTSTPSTLVPSSPTVAQRTLERQIVAVVVSTAASEPFTSIGRRGYRRDVRAGVPADESSSGHPGPVRGGGSGSLVGNVDAPWRLVGARALCVLGQPAVGVA